MTSGQIEDSPIMMSHYLRGITFPAGKADLLRHAEKNGAPEEVSDSIEQMPDDEFENMADVMKAFGEADRKNLA